MDILIPVIVVHLLATDCIVTTDVIILPYKIVYLDNKLVAATMHGCNYNLQAACNIACFICQTHPVRLGSGTRLKRSTFSSMSTSQSLARSRILYGLQTARGSPFVERGEKSEFGNFPYLLV